MSTRYRIPRARAALSGYDTLVAYGDDAAGPITDLLADLRHLAAELDLDWSDLDDRAARHFDAENVTCPACSYRHGTDEPCDGCSP